MSLGSPLVGEHAAVAPPFPSETEEHEPSRSWNRLTSSFKAAFSRGRPPGQESPAASGYLTLIPLSDSRLQPRDTRLTAAFLLAFALLVAGAVFVAVPRAVSVGEISVYTDRMSWNTSKATYQLRLMASVPLYNPNYLAATIGGELKVLFYNTVAGRVELEPTRLRPRAAPKVLDVVIDASDVPADYILSILSQCSTFPEVLVFFLKGSLTAQYLLQHQYLPTIDTYFMVDCRNGGTVPSGEPPAPPALRSRRPALARDGQDAGRRAAAAASGGGGAERPALP